MKKFTAIWLLFTFIFICTRSLPHASAASVADSPASKLQSSEAISSNYAIAPDDPEATFESARIVHNVTVNGKKGMRVHAKFSVRYGLNVPCRMIAYFYYDDGTALESGDKNYSSAEGKVSARTFFTPQYDPAVYNDLQLFVPYSALNMEAGEEYDLKFYLALYDNDGGRFFGKSGWYKFHLTMP
jgi:hypothetical protein